MCTSSFAGMKLVVVWGLDMFAAYPGFVVDAQMIALLYEPGSSGPLRNILLCVIGYPELFTAVHHQPQSAAKQRSRQIPCKNRKYTEADQHRKYRSDSAGNVSADHDNS